MDYIRQGNQSMKALSYYSWWWNEYGNYDYVEDIDDIEKYTDDDDIEHDDDNWHKMVITMEIENGDGCPPHVLNMTEIDIQNMWHSNLKIMAQWYQPPQVGEWKDLWVNMDVRK